MKKRSLSFKLMAGGSLCVLLPLLALGVFSNMRLSRDVRATNESNVVNTAKSIASLIQVTLEEEIKLAKDLSVGNTTIDVATKVAASGIDASASDIQVLDRKLAAAMKLFGDQYETIFVCNQDGIIFADGSGGKYKGISVSKRDYFQGAKVNKINLKTLIKSQKTGQPMLPVCIPIYSVSGQFVGALTTEVNPAFLSEKILATKVGQTGYIFVVDSNGLLVIHPDPKLVMELNVHSLKGMESITEKMLAHQTGVEDYLYKGVNKIAGFAPVVLNGWSVACTQPVDEFMASVYALRYAMIVIMVISLVLGLLAIWYFSRTISKPLTVVIDGLNEGADQVASAAGEVSSSSQTLAQGASEQAASIEETSASLEEMSSMTKQNANNAAQANALMQEAGSSVQTVSKSMSELTASMSDILKASDETSKIIKTIDEIAFQTNLLALNAAVEAARAGEAGAGFAVVADEVRNLALRAAEAAKTTSSLIEGTSKKVKEGAEYVQRSNSAFTQVMDNTSKIGDLIGEIAAASSEQAKGIDQVNIAVSEMETVTQQNAASAEESASASEEMNAQAEQMKSIVNDLVILVSGDSAGHPSGQQLKRPMIASRTAVKKSSSTRLPMISSRPVAKSPAKAALGFQRKKEVNPNDIIPFDETDLKDF
jgi:methyl-accepting chemotaxis protein